jgi:hypothetical protein
MMGVCICFRRVPSTLLDQFLQTRDQDAVFAWAWQDTWKPFPHTIQQLELYTYGTLHALLNPQKDRSSLLWNVVEGATPLTFSNRHDPETMYLLHIRFLTPTEVQQIAAEMAKLNVLDFISPFAELWKLDSQDKQRILHHPDFVSIRHDFERLLCFFQITAEVKDGIIRWYSG